MKPWPNTPASKINRYMSIWPTYSTTMNCCPSGSCPISMAEKPITLPWTDRRKNFLVRHRWVGQSYSRSVRLWWLSLGGWAGWLEGVCNAIFHHTTHFDRCCCRLQLVCCHTASICKCRGLRFAAQWMLCLRWSGCSDHRINHWTVWTGVWNGSRSTDEHLWQTGCK